LAEIIEIVVIIPIKDPVIKGLLSVEIDWTVRKWLMEHGLGDKADSVQVVNYPSNEEMA